MRRPLALIAAAVVVIAGLIFSVVPLPHVFGLDQAYLGALGVGVATIIATALVWYGIQS